MGTVLYGSEVAKEIRASLKEQINEIRTAGKRIPKLVVILVGNNTASLSYVSGKEKACREIGMENILLHLKEETTEGELLEEIQRLNEDASVDGILVQLPLPKHMDEHKILFAIDPKKDVDGFHPYNIGKMMLQEDTYLPCTPKGIIRLLEISGYSDLSGLRAVVIGRSNIVGKPVAQLLLNRNATVTICHSRTKNIEQICASADILIASVGQARLVKADWVKEGAAVIDVGINRVDGKLCGDVDFEDVKDKTAVIKPVTKGVGPMTIAMLLENTLEAYRKNYHAD